MPRKDKRELSWTAGDPLEGAVRKALGPPEVLARAMGWSPSDAGAPTSDAHQELHEQYEGLVREVVEWCRSEGLDAEAIARYGSRGARADFGHSYLTFLGAISVSYGAASMLLWVTFLVTSALCPLFLAAAIPAAVALAYLAKSGVHALYAGAAIGERDAASRSPDGTVRTRFTAAAKPKTLKGAWGRELVAQTPGSLASVALIVAIKLVTGLVQALPAALVFLGSPAVTVVGCAFAPLAFCLRHLLDKRTHAPLLGVSLQDGKFKFDPKQAQANIRRLGKPAIVRTAATLGRFARAYARDYPDCYAQEKKRGLTGDKIIELVLGGLPVSCAAFVGTQVLTANSSPTVQTLASAARSAVTTGFTQSSTNPLTSGRVGTCVRHGSHDSLGRPFSRLPCGGSKSRGG